MSYYLLCVFCFFVISFIPIKILYTRDKKNGVIFCFALFSLFLCLILQGIIVFFPQIISRRRFFLVFFYLFSLSFIISQILLEYSISYERIKDGFFLTDFNLRLKKGSIIILVGLFFSLLPIFLLRFPRNLRFENIFLGFISLVYCLFFVGLVGYNNLILFDFQQDVSDKKRKKFLRLTVFFVVGFLFFENYSHQIAHFYYLFFIVPFFFFYKRLLQRLFLDKEKELKESLAELEVHQREIISLVKETIRCPMKEHNSILGEVLNSYISQLNAQMVIKEYSFSGVVFYRRVGGVLQVESAEHIIGNCTPLNHNDVYKNMNEADIHSGFVKRQLNLGTLNQSDEETLDVCQKAIKKAILTKSKVVCDSPQFMEGLQRLVAFFPIFEESQKDDTQDEQLQGLLVFFKDSFSLIHEYEYKKIEELVESLSLLLSLITGKEKNAQQHRISDELEIARRIQTSITPKKLTLAGYDTANLMITATEVGGDIYDEYLTDKGNFLSIGDVSGHGLPAGIMAIIQTVAFHSIIQTYEEKGLSLDMDQLYDMVNMILCKINKDRIKSDKFMTANFLREKSGKFDYVGTHEIALLYRASKDSVEELRDLVNKTGFLGLSERIRSKTSVGSFFMESGDILVLYTDGVIEAKNHYNSQFGLERIKEIMERSSSSCSEDIIDKIVRAVMEFARDGDLKKYSGNFADDISLVVIKKD